MRAVLPTRTRRFATPVFPASLPHVGSSARIAAQIGAEASAPVLAAPRASERFKPFRTSLLALDEPPRAILALGAPMRARLLAALVSAAPALAALFSFLLAARVLGFPVSPAVRPQTARRPVARALLAFIFE